MTEEIAQICYHFKGISWDEAWGMSSIERQIVIEQFKAIIDAQNKNSGKSKVLRNSDLNK